VAGVATNIAFLERVVAHPAFAGGKVSTGLIDEHRDALFPSVGQTSERALVAAAAAEFLAQSDAAAAVHAASSDPHSPWNARDGWWPNRAPHGVSMAFADGDTMHALSIVPRNDGALAIATPHGNVVVRTRREPDGRLLIEADGARHLASVVALGEDRHVYAPGTRARLRFVDPLAHAGEEEEHAGHLMAPMSGAIVAVMVKPGDRVEKGAPLCVLEAMKMEHTIVAPAPGVVTAVNCAVGDRVAEGADLVDLEDAPR
jgi:3-methylcrotonyl-CoA carboxylase alpha subunit